MERRRGKWTTGAAAVAVLAIVCLGGCGTPAAPTSETPRAAPLDPQTRSETLPSTGASPLLPVAGAAAALFVGVGGVLLLLWRDRRTGAREAVTSDDLPRPWGRGSVS
ncbi:hypothetical protein GCM10009639_03660 [Kitasatospora putterlickiae]|uniref:Gram-positive cocci surface proteins LPxTG domain-containing protein n=1 Tax=Kitasatospora putterlickiae TaxID=221725 RepID=A0ABN1XJR4_9ACTN